MEALVWIRVIFWLFTVTSRFRALTMPLVTVPLSSPRGLPTASTVSPTASLSLSPITAGVRPVASIFTTAMSLWLSAPTTVAAWVLPSCRVTVTLEAPLTTWLLVMM